MWRNTHATFAAPHQTEQSFPAQQQSDNSNPQSINVKGSLCALSGAPLKINRIHLSVPYQYVGSSHLQGAAAAMQSTLPGLSVSMVSSVSRSDMHSAYVDFSLNCFEQNESEIAAQLLDMLDQYRVSGCRESDPLRLSDSWPAVACQVDGRGCKIFQRNKRVSFRQRSLSMRHNLTA